MFATYQSHAARWADAGGSALDQATLRSTSRQASGWQRAFVTVIGVAVLSAAVLCGFQYLDRTTALVSTKNAFVQIDPASDRAYIIAYFEDRRAARIIVGQSVAIAIAGPSDRTLPGHVVEISEKNALLRISSDGDGAMEASEIMIPVLIAFDDVIDSSELPATTSVKPTINTDSRAEKLGTNTPACVCSAGRSVSGLRTTDIP